LASGEQPVDSLRLRPDARFPCSDSQWSISHVPHPEHEVHGPRMRQTRTLAACCWRPRRLRSRRLPAGRLASGSQPRSHESWTVTDAGWSFDHEIRLVVTTTSETTFRPKRRRLLRTLDSSFLVVSKWSSISLDDALDSLRGSVAGHAHPIWAAHGD
jgi:hypothetical protein